MDELLVCAPVLELEAVLVELSPGPVSPVLASVVDPPPDDEVGDADEDDPSPVEPLPVPSPALASGPLEPASEGGTHSPAICGLPASP